MSQNGVLETLIAALNANTAAVQANSEILTALGSETGGTAGKTTSSKTTGGKTTGGKTKADDKPKSKYTKQQVTDAIVALKDAKGQADAKAVLQASGFAKLADITEDKFDELYEAATEALGGGTDESNDDDI